MTDCGERLRVQEYLDGELPPAEAAAFRAHLAGCAAEVAAFARLFSTLGRPLRETPSPELSARILERVLPSRIRRRRLVAAWGWGYAAALLACGAAAAWWAADAAHRAQLGAFSAHASSRLLGLVLFVVNALGAAILRLGVGWEWIRAVGQRLEPLSHALRAVFAQPDIGFAVWAAAAACCALLWWMRPRVKPAVREVRRVGIVGF
jgi:hypothetical protein